MPPKIFLILLITSLQSFVICSTEKSDSSENDKFIPTNEWQVVKEGQSIPKGLHVRINLQTGLKEAKLLDSTEKQSTKSHNTEQSNALLQVEQKSNQEEEKNMEPNSNLYSPEELKRVLENIKSDDNLPQFDKDYVKRVKEQFKDYEQLKKELGDMNMSVKSDAEILRDLFQKYEKIMSDKTLDPLERESEILDILVYFEYLVHQIDNANEFISLNGFSNIIFKNLNNTDYKIRSESLNILGSCVQNNAKAQISALESGAIVTVLRLLATEQINTVKIRAVYSLSSLLRRFPLAQKHFIKNGGLNILAKIFSKPENMKIQLKIVTLIYDLLIEQKESLEDKDNLKEKVKQYKEVDLKNTLIKNDWCVIFDNFLINIANIKQRDHDAIERCLNVMLLVSDSCLSTFNNKNLLNVLTDFYNNYSNLSADENTVDPDSFPFFTNLKNVSHQLLSVVRRVKTEL